MDKIITKRTADWLEKMSVAAMAVGIFQGRVYGIVLGITCYIASIYLLHCCHKCALQRISDWARTVLV